MLLGELALYSDRLFMAAVGVYVLAMVLHGAEYAAERAGKPVLAGAGGPQIEDVPPAPGSEPVGTVHERIGTVHERIGTEGGRVGTEGERIGTEGERIGTVGERIGTVGGPVGTVGGRGGAGRGRSERWGRMAVALVVLGAGLHLLSVAARGIAAGRWPLGNMYEFTSAICLVAVLGWLVLLQRSSQHGDPERTALSSTPTGRGCRSFTADRHLGPGGPGGQARRRRPSTLRPVGLFVLLPVVVLLFLAGTVLYARAAPVVPALQSYWLVIHVTTISASSGLLLIAGVASLLFLLARSGRLRGIADRLPAAEVLDRMAYRVTIIAFPLFTFAVIAGAIWAEAAWGRFWGWDPKETVAFVSWVVYAAYLHARATAGWRTGRAAWVNIAGFATVVFNLFFINMVIAGLHSYAGVG